MAEPELLRRGAPRSLLLLPLLLAGAALAAGDGAGKRGGKGLFDIDLSTLTRPPLWEPTLEEYFPERNGPRDEHGLPSPVVLTKPTREEFVRHARKGYPILVSDWGTGMQYDGWSGKDFADKFPFGYMKAEYIHDMPGFKRKDHDTKTIDGELRFNLGNFKPDKKTMWYNFTRPASKRYKDDPQKPVTGPYVWHVKDELTPPQKKKVQARFDAPSFLQDPLNRAKMNRSFEVWFSPGAGAGAGAHNDGYCESVVSLQLRGDKKWRKMLEPEMTFLSSYDEFDGGVYQAGYWKPDLGFVVSQGAAIIWPPGYLHETKTLPPADGACGAALTLQFAFPQPVQFLRAFLPRLSLSAEVGHCSGGAWSGYPTLYVRGIKPSPKGETIKKQLEQMLAAVDANKDEQVTVEEVRTFLASPAADLSGEGEEHGAAARDQFLQFRAEDTVAYHDMDGDMVASRQELWDSLVQWNVVRIRIREGLKLVNVADRRGLEKFETSLDYMRRKPAEFPKKLRPELEQLFSLPKGTKVFKTTKHINSFSDPEFFSQLHEQLDRLQDQHGGGRGGREEM
eukprot:TRINITY_DN3146_c3_g1_i1.p1 TRINITY_DN3146_c3_g1~~TRINITY_DN3146_c3_g1_i1.p1  ORF type:complete len:588 (+),score=150.49 TRINITY_DN3146_c3_g1_i1:74-1765(+)